MLGDLGFDALLPLLRARTVDDVDAALDAWVEPGNNVVIADRHGAVRFRNAGRIPVHPEPHRRGIVATDPEGGWAGWVDLPRYDIAADGQVVTANERRGAESDLIGTTFAPRHRAERLHALLRGPRRPRRPRTSRRSTTTRSTPRRSRRSPSSAT